MKRLFLASALLALTPLAMADTTVELHKATDKGPGESVGSVTFKDTDYGLLATPDISGLPGQGMHGFHLHTNPSCDPSTTDGKVTPAGAAGGHFDPKGTDTHAGPYVEDSHLGDMPLLVADNDGNITTPVLAPRLKESDLGGHAIVIHEGGDNYSDTPKLGGGGARWACGVVEGAN
ncbi:superoxide dismutase family protein [Kushneria marisflavi]|uniref:Superoxide dismutase [Cu-Zn] n=1 Tax=Kushneria marisflavi TaxID=157779 RepID=A0A240UQW5_9GAMM|nr:superoxide dismutase family protein [Kushneria marisflavi]ART63505.1 superoxide dismutase [Kushneria marisflavi]RKD84572.1 Cu-Zn family superoxide dismutase [Kushneria marisflavi]